MKFKIIAFYFLFISLVGHVVAQNSDAKWNFGLSVGSAMYSDADGKKLGGAFVSQAPRVSISTYFLKNITIEAAISGSVLDSQNYTTFDGAIRYDFGNSFESVVPYVLLGGSFIDAAALTPTLNFGVGNTFWVFPRYGLNIQIMYKFSEARFTSQYSHLYTSVGLVYSFKHRNLNRRLWDMKH